MLTLLLILFKFKFIQKSSKKIKESKETGPRVARANLGGPDLQLLKDKLILLYLLQPKTVRMIQTAFREGKEITSKTKKLKN